MFAYSYILFKLLLCSGFYLFSTEKVIPSCFFKLLRIFFVILLLLFIVFGDIKGNHFFSQVDVVILCSVGARCTDNVDRNFSYILCTSREVYFLVEQDDTKNRFWLY